MTGETSVPGDKSISHRALILGALCDGNVRVRGLLESEDILATAAALKALGAKLQKDGADWTVRGVGVGGFHAPSRALDFGNSGTGARLMMGTLATTPITAIFQGDSSLSKRPMERVLTPLRQFGLQVLHSRDGRLPIVLQGARFPVPIRYQLPVASAQIKSAILLAALNVPGRSTVIETEPTRDHTERMLRAFGVEVAVEQAGDKRRISVTGPGLLHPVDVTVPGDPSSAAFLAAAALLVPNSDILIRDVLVNPTRTGFYEVARAMGGDISFEHQRRDAGESIADIRVRTSSLKGVDVPAERAPSMIDEYPVLAMLAARAQGVTRMAGLGELRVKESDRLSAIAQGLHLCGVNVTEGEDSLTVEGQAEIRGGPQIETHMDHRIAMAFLILGLTAKDPITVDGADMIATSFPDFVPLMRSLGATLEDGPTTDGVPP